MALNFPKNGERPKTAAFVNLHMPAADGSAGEKLCYIALNSEDKVQASIAQHLLAAKESESPEKMAKAIEIFLSGIVVVVNSAEKKEVATDRFDFSGLQETA